MSGDKMESGKESKRSLTKADKKRRKMKKKEKKSAMKEQQRQDLKDAREESKRMRASKRRRTKSIGSETSDKPSGGISKNKSEIDNMDQEEFADNVLRSILGASPIESTRPKLENDAPEEQSDNESEKDDESNEEDGKAPGEEETNDNGKRYSPNILFVGQLPYDVTSDMISEHFAKHGVSDIKIRLLTDKKTKKPRGIAFIEVKNDRQLAAALRVHHTRLRGRMINVERTCGGGGNNSGRKEKIDNLRKIQGKKVLKEVRVLIDEVLALHPRTEVSASDFDDRVIEALGSFPRQAIENIVTEYVNSEKLNSVQNKSAWIMGILKRYREMQFDGDDFVQKEKKGKGGKGKHPHSSNRDSKHNNNDRKRKRG